MDSNLWNKLDSQDWGEIMDKLYAHAIARINWFGLKSEVGQKGWEPKDFANEAVTLLYEDKRKWDETKEPSLVNFLKSVINSLIYNLITSKEVKVQVDKDLTQDINDSLFIDLMLENRIVAEDFIDKLEDTMLQDQDMWLVFKSLIEGFKPKEIHEKYGLEIEIIRNAQKRLRRHIQNITDL